jgi:hypothetical protein
MKPPIACLLLALASAGVPAMARAAGDPTEELRACSDLTHTERAKCLDRLSREISSQSTGPRATSGSAGTATLDSWIFSETTSPIDYSPVVIASVTASGAGDGAGMKLSIACRGTSTSLALAAPGVLPASGGYTVSYAVDGATPTTLAAAAAPSGTGIDLRTDVVRLLESLPDQGEIAFRIVVHRGGMSEGRYSLPRLKAARERMAVSCKWPIKSDATRK